LVKQTYPGKEDHRSHFEYLLPFFRDHRYLKVDGRPLFLVYKPFEIPDRQSTLKLWRNMAQDAGLPGIFFVGTITSLSMRTRLPDFDGYTRNQPPEQLLRYGIGALRRAPGAELSSLLRCVRGLCARPQFFSSAEIVRYAPQRQFVEREFPQVLSSWDDTPRQGRRGTAIIGSGTELLRRNLSHAVESLQSRQPERRLLFLKSWNEWGEGNYVEPDTLHGLASLRVIRDTLMVQT
jgi:hypothetical protein